VILCTNPNLEGEATAMYLARLLLPIGVKVTRIASGLPVGGTSSMPTSSPSGAPSRVGGRSTAELLPPGDHLEDECRPALAPSRQRVVEDKTTVFRRLGQWKRIDPSHRR